MILKNAYLVDHKVSLKADLLIEGGFIKKIGKIDEKDYPQEELKDLQGKLVTPSFVDLHVHFRDPGFTYKEDLETGSRAALRGGYTVVNAMANTKPVIDDRKKHKEVMDRAKKLDLIDYYQVAAVSKGMKGKELVDIKGLSSQLKFLSDDGKGVLSNDLMLKACQQVKENNIGIMVHAEDPEISPYNYRAAEDIITIRDIYLSKLTGARIHFCHVSTFDSIEAIMIGKKYGLNISCEVTPHHLALYDNDFRVNPPIREKRDVERILEGIKDGTVDAIATDHAPHSKEDKANGSPGGIGLETAFPVAYTKLVKSGIIDLNKLSALMSYNPGHILALDHGEIKEGARADLAIIDLEEKSLFDDSYFKSKSHNSVFYKQEFDSRVLATMRKGVLHVHNR